MYFDLYLIQPRNWSNRNQNQIRW